MGMQEACTETLRSAAKQITVPEDKCKLVQLGNGNGLVCGVGPFCHYAERDGVRASPLPIPRSKFLHPVFASCTSFTHVLLPILLLAFPCVSLLF